MAFYTSEMKYSTIVKLDNSHTEIVQTFGLFYKEYLFFFHGT